MLWMLWALRKEQGEEEREDVDEVAVWKGERLV